MTNFERIKSLDNHNLYWLLFKLDISRDQLEAMSIKEFYELLREKCCCIFRNDKGFCTADEHMPGCSDGIKKYLQKYLDKCCVNWLESEEAEDEDA